MNYNTLVAKVGGCFVTQEDQRFYVYDKDGAECENFARRGDAMEYARVVARDAR